MVSFVGIHCHRWDFAIFDRQSDQILARSVMTIHSAEFHCFQRRKDNSAWFWKPATSSQRSAVVIELAQVRQERAAKEQARAEQRQRLAALPLDQLRWETPGLQPPKAELGRPAWESEWTQLPEVVRANYEAKEALNDVGYAEAEVAATTRRLQQVAQAEQAYR